MTSPPNGSGLIESVYLEYFNGLNLPTAPGTTANVGLVQTWSIQRAPFRSVGGLATGTSSLKSEQYATVFGGTAGVAYHPPYGTVNDTTANVGWSILDVMADAQAHLVYTLMRTKADIVDGATLKLGKGQDYTLPLIGTCGDDLASCAE